MPGDQIRETGYLSFSHEFMDYTIVSQVGYKHKSIFGIVAMADFVPACE
jgi:hypothetical protein